MSRVGNTYTDENTGVTYECVGEMTISPTLITDRETRYGIWKRVQPTGEGPAKTANCYLSFKTEDNEIIDLGTVIVNTL